MYGDSFQVLCPYCFAPVDFEVDVMTTGEFVEDCEVCCRPWRVRVYRDPETGEASIDVDRAQ